MSAPQVGDVIHSAQQVHVLPDGAVVLDAHGCPWLRDELAHPDECWWASGNALGWGSGDISLPVTLLYLPDAPPRPESSFTAQPPQ